jgi:hypothetical protein
MIAFERGDSRSKIRAKQKHYQEFLLPSAVFCTALLSSANAVFQTAVCVQLPRLQQVFAQLPPAVCMLPYSSLLASYKDYKIGIEQPGKYKVRVQLPVVASRHSTQPPQVVLNSDAAQFGGLERVDEKVITASFVHRAEVF